ncbi:GLUG motif-containing protein [Halosimplex halobium]|uniref:GLUG motif-containing protein n=1 Tax=Halosimplex halobium TaxID=3396618 RepID=UPI003F554443
MRHSIVSVLLIAFLVLFSGCAGLGLSDSGSANPSSTPNDGATPTTSEGSTTPTPVDSDGDGVNDSREESLGLDPERADTDGDGLDDGAELANGTDPIVADTDSDGLDDGAELANGTDPTVADTDGDGLEDGAELANETDPLVADTDDDGLKDGAELAKGTDPTFADTDLDGLEDGPEVANGTDPTVADTDDDGLEDGPEVIEYGTNPLVVDTDQDGLEDSTELEIGTLPTRWDTDGDGLNDGRERELGTDPTNRDTDSDGLPDGAEVKRTDILPGADPLRKNIYVEVDYMTDGSLSRSDYRFDRVTETFANAPVENPDGTRGISLHIRLNDSVPSREQIYFEDHDREDDLDDFDTYESRFRDYETKGYHYALGAKDLRRTSPDMMRLGGMAGTGRFVFEPSESIFAHELGHSLGLTEFRGIDSEELSYTEYPSVMNYNAGHDVVSYATGEESDVSHNDWADVTDSMDRGFRVKGIRVRCPDPSFAGGDGTAANPYEIETIDQFNCIRADLDAHYELTADVDATGRTGFKPVGDAYATNGHREAPFTGTLDGNGNAIRNLTLNQPSRDQVALFGVMAGTVRDLRVPDAEVVGGAGVAVLASENRGTIRNVTVTGYVSGPGRGTEAGRGIGAVAALNGDRSQLRGTDTGARIIDTTANATVKGTSAGGLVGTNVGIITRSAAFGDVNGGSADNPSELGGLVGGNGGVINRSFAMGNVTGWSRIGGLVGTNYRGRIADAYATGTVRGHYQTIGGLVGQNLDGDVVRVYAASPVKTTQNPSEVGAVFGERQSGTVESVYWNTQTAGVDQAVGKGLVDVTPVDAPTGEAARDALPGLAFGSVWRTTDTTPTLRWVDGADLPGNATVDRGS